MLTNRNIKKILFLLTIVGIFIIVIFSFVIEQEKQLQLETRFPTLEIMVDDNVWPREKVYFNGEASLIYADNIGNIASEDMQIRARGNGSLTHDKTSYKIKFDDKVYLMGEEVQPARDWVLLANYIDLSMMRNFYATQCMEKLEHIAFAPNTMFVEVIFNNFPVGVYQVYESIELDEARLDIDEDSSEIQNGFLIERDLLPTGTEGTDYVVVSDIPYNIKSDVHNVEQADYVKDVISQVEAAIYSEEQETIEEVMNVDSSIDVFLLCEFGKNYDVGWGSFYMHLYPNDDTLYFGPPWDFDLTIGNDMRLDNGSYEGMYMGNYEYNLARNHHWYMALLQQDWYKIKVVERWNEIKHIFLDTIEEVEAVASKYVASFELDQELWTFQRRLETHIMRPDVLAEFATYNQHVDYLVEWIENRYLWLDHYFNYDIFK